MFARNNCLTVVGLCTLKPEGNRMDGQPQTINEALISAKRHVFTAEFVFKSSASLLLAFILILLPMTGLQDSLADYQIVAELLFDPMLSVMAKMGAILLTAVFGLGVLLLIVVVLCGVVALRRYAALKRAILSAARDGLEFYDVTYWE